MNKRIRKKHNKLTNSNRIVEILKNLSKKFTLENVKYGCDVYLYRKGDNSLCTFNIKGFKDEVLQISKNLKLYFVASLTYGDALIDWIQYENGYAEGYQCVLVES